MPIAPTQVKLEDIRIDGGTQSRCHIDQETVDSYADELELLPPSEVYHDGSEYWLVDGFHRYHAHRKAGLSEMPCIVRQGTKREAVLASLGANAHHGLRRTRNDKHKALSAILDDSEWALWPNQRIATACGVTLRFVQKVQSARKSAHPTNIHRIESDEAGSGSENADEGPAAPTAPRSVVREAKAIQRSGGEARIVERGGSSYAMNVSNTVIKPVEAEVSDEPTHPWDPFVSEVEEHISSLRSLARSMQDTFGYESNGKKLTAKYAHYYSYAGTIGAINAIVRTLEDGIPVAESNGNPGYISKQREEVLRKSKQVA